MSLMDIMECITDGTHHEIVGLNGSFGVSIGDVVSGIFGARHTHIFGAEIKLVTDPEDFLMGKLEHAVPAVAALLGGIGGQATFVYAQNTSATYGGPKVDIRRAPAYSKQTDYIIPREGAPNAVNDPPDPIDVPLCIAVTALSALVNLVPAVLELVIRFKYPSYGASNPSAQTEATIEGYGDTPQILKDCVYTITSRLMGLLKEIEEKGNFTQVAYICSLTVAYKLDQVGDFLLRQLGRLAQTAEDIFKSAQRQLNKIREELANADFSSASIHTRVAF